MNRIQIFAKVGDRIAEIIKDTNNVRFLKRMETARRSDEFRLLILKATTSSIEKKKNVPLITFKEYVEELFPEGSYWQEGRDILLIRIYEKLFDWLISINFKSNIAISSSSEEEGDDGED